MEIWSILNDNVKYIQHDEKSVHDSLKAEEKQMIDMDFSSNPDQLKTNYLDIYMREYMQIWYRQIDLMRIQI